MDATLLIHSIVRQTTVLIAQLATHAGGRAMLTAHRAFGHAETSYSIDPSPKSKQGDSGCRLRGAAAKSGRHSFEGPAEPARRSDE